MNLPANNSWKSRFMRIMFYQGLLEAFELRNKKMNKKKKKTKEETMKKMKKKIKMNK